MYLVYHPLILILILILHSNPLMIIIRVSVRCVYDKKKLVIM
jgi:hypothetical protein